VVKASNVQATHSLFDVASRGVKVEDCISTSETPYKVVEQINIFGMSSFKKELTYVICPPKVWMNLFVSFFK
jgi:hypothetical protein